MLVLRGPRCRELSGGEARLQLDDPRGCTCARRGGCRRPEARAAAARIRYQLPVPVTLDTSLSGLRAGGGRSGARSALAFLIGEVLGSGRG